MVYEYISLIDSQRTLDLYLKESSILSTKITPLPFIALLVNTRESACRMIQLKSGLNSHLLTAQSFFSFVKGDKEKVGSAVFRIIDKQRPNMIGKHHRKPFEY